MTTSIFAHEPGGRTFEAGETIFHEGDPASGMFVVQAGEVDLSVGTMLVETVGEDGFFGEMGLIESEPRTATAIARTPCRLVEVDLEMFKRQVSRNPFFAIEVMRTLSQRLRRADSALER
jgi:CRP/FNR family transcriptional regulator, cyclic AMP receptor protein